MTAIARANAPLITGSDRFSAVWPQVFSDVVRSLCRRGVELHAAEDAAQEAGTRAFDLNIPFDDAADLRRWVLTAARRIAVDDARKSSRIDREADVVESRSRCDVPAEAEGRLRLAAVRDAFPRLSAVERAAIFADSATSSVPRKEAVRLAVRRHRARAHLLQMIEGVAVLVLVAWRRAARPAAVAMAAVPVAFVVLMAMPHLPGDRPSLPAIGAEATAMAPPTPAAAVHPPPAVAEDAPPTASPVAVAAAGRVPPARPEAEKAIQPPSFDAEVARPGPDGHGTTVSSGEKEADRRIVCVGDQSSDSHVCAPDVAWPLS